MKGNSTYFFIGGFLSLVIYVSLLFFIFSYLGQIDIKSKQYSSSKNNFIEVSISDIKAPKKHKAARKKKLVEKKLKKKKIEKKKRNKKRKVKKSIKRTSVSNSLKSLFKNINTSKYTKKYKEKNLTKKIVQNENSRIPQKSNNLEIENKASKIIKSLSLENVNSSKTKNTGEYNKYLGKISDILDQKWQDTPGTIAGNSATVTVRIDKFGDFSYKIDSLSYNNEFNAKLQSFLESLKDEKFPAYKKGNYIEIRVNFKDE